MVAHPQLLGSLRWKTHLNPGGRGYSEPRSCHCTPDQDSISKQERKEEKKRKVIHTYIHNEVLFGHKREGNLVLHSNMHGNGGYNVSEMSQEKKGKHYSFSLIMEAKIF